MIYLSYLIVLYSVLLSDAGVMNENFMNVLLDGIEQYHEDPDTEQLAELYLAIVLAFNLQYTTLPPSAANPPKSCETADGDSEDKSQSNGDVEGNKESSKTAMGADSENIIIKLLSKRENTKYFTEKLLLLFNREGLCDRLGFIFFLYSSIHWSLS